MGDKTTCECGCGGYPLSVYYHKSSSGTIYLIFKIKKFIYGHHRSKKYFCAECKGRIWRTVEKKEKMYCSNMCSRRSRRRYLKSLTGSLSNRWDGGQTTQRRMRNVVRSNIYKKWGLTMARDMGLWESAIDLFVKYKRIEHKMEESK